MTLVTSFLRNLMLNTGNVLYRVSHDAAVVVRILAEGFELHSTVIDPETRRVFHVIGLEIHSCPIRLTQIEIPDSVQDIQAGSFADCSMLAHIILHGDKLREIHGFERCGVEHIHIPGSVEIIGETAFEGCERLEQVTFDSPSGIRLIQGFAHTPALRSIVLPSSQLEITASAFRNRFGSRQIFIHYSQQSRQNARSFRMRSFVPHINVPIPRQDTWSILRTVALDDPAIQSSLMLPVRLRVDFTNRGGRPKFLMPVSAFRATSSGKTTCTLDSVVAMFGVGPDFECRVVARRPIRPSLKFTVRCLTCSLGTLTVLSPLDGQGLIVKTRTWCGHFFVGRVIPKDRRSAMLLITNPRNQNDYAYHNMHPLRVMARALLRVDRLPAAHRLLLRGWIETTAIIHHGIAESNRPVGLENLLSNSMHGTIHVQISRPPVVPTVHLEYQSGPVVTLMWLAPWAVRVIGMAQYYELDCSFEGLAPYVYSIPMAVRANRGIPLGIVIAPTERQDVFRMLSKLLIEQGMASQRLTNLPVLTDEGSALSAYARADHSPQYLCYRHLLESLGSGTFVALLARRLLFTKTRVQFDNLIDQTLSDYAIGCRMSLITDQGKTKFCRLFGIGEIGETGLPALDATVFEKQALWGERGTVFGVATCTNHIEGLHGRINQATRTQRNLVNRIATIVEIITKSAQNWADRVQRCRSKNRDRLAAQAESHGFTSGECQDPECDRGRILSRRLDQPFPCVHVVSVTTFSPSPLAQFPLCDHDPPNITCCVVEPWDTSGDSKQNGGHGKIVEFEQTDMNLRDTGKEIQFLNRIRNELKHMNKGRDFRHSVAEMAFQWGRFYGRENRRPEHVRAARSEFLVECVAVLQKGTEWSQEN
jgi:hypothetical protein